MTTDQPLYIADFNYPLPDERIAKYPLAERDHSKLLVYRDGQVSEDLFYRIGDHIAPHSLLIYNNTRVIQARLEFRKPTGARIEVFCLEPLTPHDYQLSLSSTAGCTWKCMVGNAKKWHDEPIELQAGRFTLRAYKEQALGNTFAVRFSWDEAGVSFAEILDAAGELPIPPYLNRKTEESDKTTYQTVYSKIKGSVAAPTAGLHFTPEVLSTLDAHGIDREELTLHVGAGTFRPVKSEEIEGHEMHTEFISVRRETIAKLIRHQGEAIAVGTTSVRTLESLYYMALKVLRNKDLAEHQLHVSQWEPYDERCEKDGVGSVKALQALADWMDARGIQVLHSSTQIIIAPGYDYKIVKMLITNFHQPQSTLLLLVSAFVKGDWHKIYDYALSHDFRFLSYGDSSLLIP